MLYPTAGLAVGRIMAEEWAMVASRAYNNWLYERFLNSSERLKGIDATLNNQNAKTKVTIDAGKTSVCQILLT